jgi:hypothetical protein
MAENRNINLLTVKDLVTSVLAGCELEDYDYYIYNNRFFVPVQVDLDDNVEPTECLLHICTKGADPQTDRFERPYSVHTIANLLKALNF